MLGDQIKLHTELKCSKMRQKQIPEKLPIFNAVKIFGKWEVLIYVEKKSHILEKIWRWEQCKMLRLTKMAGRVQLHSHQ